MGAPLHETEKNFIRFGVIHANRLNKLGLGDTEVAAVSPSNITGLETKIDALNVHETDAFLRRQCKKTLTKLSTLTSNIGKPGAPTLTTAATGGTIDDGVTAHIKITAIDQNGVESIASDDTTLEITGDGSDDNTLTIKDMPQVKGAASYRIYPSLTTTFAGYVADASKTIEGASGVTLTTLTGGLTGSSAPPTTSAAVTPALSNDEIAEAVTTGTYAALLSKITDDDSTVLTTLDRGGQVTS